MGDEQKTFADQVDELVGKATQNDKGAQVLPDEVLEGVSDELSFAAKERLRYKNTQSAYTRAQQEYKKVSKVNEKLVDHLSDTVTLHISPEKRAELNDLKHSDPDKWREKLDEHEREAREVLQGKLSEYEQEGEQLSELDIRKAKLESFNETTGLELNDQVIEDELPASYTKQLEKGDITFDQFLEKAQKFLTKGKKVAGSGEGDTKDNEKDFGKISGGSTPEDAATKGDVVESYKKTIF